MVSRNAHIDDGAATGAGLICATCGITLRNFTRPASHHKAGGIIGLVRTHGFGLAIGYGV